MSTPTLLIKPVVGMESAVDEFYKNHGTYHDGDSGLDLFCLSTLKIPANAIGFKIPLGICAAMHETPAKTVSYFLYPRSSMGAKTPLRLANSVGIIDSGYTGELVAIVDNLSSGPFTIKRGERYLQICAANLGEFRFEIVSRLGVTSRGSGGLGST